MITGVVGITLWTSDLGRMFDFYHGILHLPLHSSHDNFVAFELGEVRFNIGLHDQVHGASADPYRVMPHLGVDDIHGEYRRLKEEGVEFIRPPEREHWGGWIATLKDPDGNILQLLQLP
jgi:predicted enzyme related to lactoylglutathione lyase